MHAPDLATDRHFGEPQLKDSVAAGPSSNVGLKEGGELISTGWEFLSAVANLMEFQVYDGIDQLAQDYLCGRPAGQTRE
jgi:hypothetical protein